MEDVDQHRRYLEIVFRPSFSDSLREMATIKNKDKGAAMFQNLWFIKRNEAGLRKYSHEIASPAYLLSSIALAKSFLPKKSSRDSASFYVADDISNEGCADLIDNCDNPFNFFDLYNKAAKKDKESPPCFSDATMAYLKELEKRSFQP